MRAALIGAIALLSLSAASAGAANSGPPAWYEKADALVHSLLGEPARPDRDVVAPPPGIDPQMAVVPSAPPGAMPTIRPPARPEQQ